MKQAIREVLDEDAYQVQRQIQRLSMRSSAEFILENIALEKIAETRTALMDRCLAEAPATGLVMEFGVYRGNSIRHIARVLPNRPVFGFDSFEGLKEPWIFYEKGLFSDMAGGLPKVPGNVTLIKGWFQNTLPGFLAAHPGPIALLNIDSDLYSSCRYVLESVSDRVVAGTVIAFDEFYNYPGWEQGEYRAFREWEEATGVETEYLGFVGRRSPSWLRDGSTGEQVAMKVLRAPTRPFVARSG
jgi:hypothetical protein